MKNLLTLTATGLVALASFGAPAYAYDGHYGHGRPVAHFDHGWHGDHYYHGGYYRPGPVVYYGGYAPQPVYYYPQPVAYYEPPVFSSFSFIIR